LVNFITGVNSTWDAVIAIHRCACLAGAVTVAGLFPVTVLIISTNAPRRFELTECTAAVTICNIAVVTIFPGIQDAIPALRLYIAGAGGFITGRPIPAGVTGRGTVILGITDLISVAEETVISTVVVIGGMETSSGSFVTSIIRTGNSIIAVNGCTKLTTTYEVTYLFTVTEIPIVAKAVVRYIYTGVINFITEVSRAVIPVTAVNWCAFLAGTATITGFISVTVLVIGT